MMNRLLRPAPLTGAAAALFIVLALAACGGGGDSGGVASLGGSKQSGSGDTTSTTSNDPEDAALEFVKCMREHGVDMPDPTAGGGIRLRVTPGSAAKAEKAQKACRSILEKAAPKLTEEQRTVMQDAALAFARCMRQHGVDVPDPTFGNGGIVMRRNKQGGTAPDLDDPQFKAAQKACQPIVDRAAREAGLPKADGPRTERSGGPGS
jgi:hypothetical protein